LSWWASVSIPLWCDCDVLVWNVPHTPSAPFQSHYGAIATEAMSGVVKKSNSFNPTMVRLRPPRSSLARSQFQSHYGAIATNNSKLDEPRTTPFQSHYGAIATIIIMIAPKVYWMMFQSHYGAIATAIAREHWRGGIGFNPTMVRLRLLVRSQHIVYALSFNPTMVRLRLQLLDMVHIDTHESFNPTMVRLRRKWANLYG